MIQQRSPDKKKTIFSIALVVVLISSTLYMLLGYSGSTSSSLPGQELSPLVDPSISAVAGSVRFEKNVLENKEFFMLVQQSSLSDVDPLMKGRSNPFVPLFELKTSE